MMRLNWWCLNGLIAASMVTPGLAAEPAESLRDQVRAYRVAHEKSIIHDFADLLSIPNVATEVADIERNAAHIRRSFERRGFETRLLSAGPGTPPAIYGALNSPGATRTIIFYAHYDGQPAGQKGWRSDPWTPVVRSGNLASDSQDIDWRSATRIDPDWRLYGRSTSDDKAPIQALLTALDALAAAGRKPSVNIKLFYEGEEEQGSGNLAKILRDHAQLFKADILVFGDGPRHQSGKMLVYLGARGFTALDLTVYGPARPLHSGHYGNWAPNPAAMLAHLLASMRRDDGHIMIDGFYDDVRPLTATERQSLAALPDIESDLRRELALGRTESPERLGNAVSLPALNVRGIRVGDVGVAASNTIFPEARASIDFRLVPGQTPHGIKQRTEAFLRDKGWHVVTSEPSDAERAAHPKIVKTDWRLGYPAYRGAASDPATHAVIQSLQRIVGEPILVVPMMGGSVPMHDFASVLSLPIITVPIANHDNNQHAENENLRLQNLWDGIEIYAALLNDLHW